jgi:hypothetical protein
MTVVKFCLWSSRLWHYFIGIHENTETKYSLETNSKGDEAQNIVQDINKKFNYRTN